MKVLYVNTTITHYNHPLFEKIVAAGCELTIYVPETNASTVGKNVKTTDEKIKHYKILRGKVRRAWYGKDIFCNLKQVIVDEKPQIVLIGWPYMLQLFFYPGILSYIRRSNIKLILHEIPFQVPPFGDFSYYKKHPIYDEQMHLLSSGVKFYINAAILMLVRKYLYKKADASLNYATTAYDIWQSYGVPRDKIFVRYNSGDTDALFQRKNDVVVASPLLPPCEKRILHIGRLVAWKRVDLLLEAYGKVITQHPDAELTIVGDGPELASLRTQAERMKIQDKVRFVGGVYDPFELGRYMNESAVYVLAGMGGLSINDAMCYSMPVICSVCDGTERDLIEDGKNGFFFEEGNASDLAKKICTILEDPKLSKQMGQYSLDIIQNKININTVAQRYVDTFTQVLK